MTPYECCTHIVETDNGHNTESMKNIILIGINDIPVIKTGNMKAMTCISTKGQSSQFWVPMLDHFQTCIRNLFEYLFIAYIYIYFYFQLQTKLSINKEDSLYPLPFFHGLF
jgi:hypothetical protein